MPTDDHINFLIQIYFNIKIGVFEFIGRAITFTSGEESLHYTERVLKGTRFAITVGFTCNPKNGVKDPKL